MPTRTALRWRGGAPLPPPPPDARALRVFVVFIVEFWVPFPPPGPHPPPRLVLVARGVYDAPHHAHLCAPRSTAQGYPHAGRTASPPAPPSVPPQSPPPLFPSRGRVGHGVCGAQNWSPRHRAMLARRGLGNRPTRGAEEQQGRCAPRQPVGGGADVEPRRRRGLQADTPTENIRSRGQGGGAWSCERGIRERGGVTRGEGHVLPGQTQPKPPADGRATRPPCMRPAPPSAATRDRDGPSRPRGRAARRRSGRRPAPAPPTGQVGGGGSGARPTVPPAAANRA